MNKNRKGFFYLLMFFVLLFSSVCQAESVEIYPFNSLADKAHFEKIIQMFRCLVCQNQNLADSNAPLAKDIRQIIYQKLQKGASEQQIKNYLVSRYGVYILFKPPFFPLTYVLWLAPFILLLTVVLKVGLTIRKRKVVTTPIR
jgi:cytochrome c-type biogenesis protein CcmH